MFLSIQFPLADCREFFGEGVRLLGRPTWPSVSPDVDFVRSFGSIRKRKLGGLVGWIGENALCEADRALRFSKIKNFRDAESSLSIPLGVALRRFYFDGLAVGKFEVGITTDPKYTRTLNRRQTHGIIKHCLDLPVTIPALSAKAVSGPLANKTVSTVLGLAGKPLSRFYAASSTPHPPPVDLKDWWVLPGSPLLFLVCRPSEHIYIPFLGNALPRDKDLGCDLSYCGVPYQGRTLRMWIMGLSADTNYRDVRALRICLLRLHAEHEALHLILQNVASKRIAIRPRSNESNTLQLYLNEATRRISRLGSKADSLAEGDLAELARESEDLMNPGDRDDLLAALRNIDLRQNIFSKVSDYARTEVHIKELYMESKYKITGGAQGAVGDNAQASNNVFNQWNQSGGDLTGLAKELATLRAELGKRATESEQFESAAAVAKAEGAAKNGNGPTAFEHLKTAGKWALEVASSIGVPVALEALKKAVGI
jgi:uncharacterized protein YukE